MTITIGADPEVFLSDTRTGLVRSAVGLVGGTKEKPLPVPDLGKGYAVQEDNVMLEYNIPPQNNAEGYGASIRGMLSWCEQHVKRTHPTLGLDLACERLFPHDQLDGPQAHQFGCAPDFDGYGEGRPHPSVDPKVLDEETGSWRFAGGHVHVGFSGQHKCSAPPFVQAVMADLFLGLPSVGSDPQDRRRKLYGSPGRFRPTEYGFEYRVLSNFWIFSDESAEDMGRRAINLGLFLSSSESRLLNAFQEIPWLSVKEAILKNDEVKAADLLAFAFHDLKIPEVV